MAGQAKSVAPLSIPSGRGGTPDTAALCVTPEECSHPLQYRYEIVLNWEVNVAKVVGSGLLLPVHGPPSQLQPQTVSG